MAGEVMQLDPKKLDSLASDIRKCQQQMKSKIDNAKAQIDGLKNVWTGDGADTFNTQFKALYEASLEALTEAERLATALNEAVATYLAGQKKIEATASNMKKLPDISFR